MSLTKIYSEIEKEKKNSVKSKTVSMDLNDYIEEHNNLIEVLREGSREELLAEAEKQEDELEECLKEHGMDQVEEQD